MEGAKEVGMAESMEMPQPKSEKKKILLDSVTLNVEGKFITITSEDLEKFGFTKDDWIMRRWAESEDLMKVALYKLLNS